MSNLLEERIEKIVNNWKGQIENFELQLSLGKKEALDEFESQKANFHNYIQDLKNKVDNIEHKSEDIIYKLKTKIEELEVQLALGKADTKDEFIKQKTNIDEKLSEISHNVKSFTKNADHSFHDTIEKLNGKVENFRANIDILHLQFVLGKKELEKVLIEKQNDLQPHLNKLKKDLNNVIHTNEEKWDNFGKEINKGIEHIGKAIKSIF